MPRLGGLQGLMAPPEVVTELPPVPPGHVQVTGTPPGHDVFLPPDLAQDSEFLSTLLAQLPQVPAWRPAEGSRAYWDGGQRNLSDLRGPESSPMSPSADHYRVVADDAEADAALLEGEPPLIWRWPSAPTFTDLKAQQEAQYAAPEGTPLFAADAAGRLYRTGDSAMRPWDQGGAGLSGLAGLLARPRGRRR